MPMNSSRQERSSCLDLQAAQVFSPMSGKASPCGSMKRTECRVASITSPGVHCLRPFPLRQGTFESHLAADWWKCLPPNEPKGRFGQKIANQRECWSQVQAAYLELSNAWMLSFFIQKEPTGMPILGVSCENPDLSPA